MFLSDLSYKKANIFKFKLLQKSVYMSTWFTRLFGCGNYLSNFFGYRLHSYALSLFSLLLALSDSYTAILKHPHDWLLLFRGFFYLYNL